MQSWLCGCEQLQMGFAGNLDHQTPHAGHHSPVQAGVNFIHENAAIGVVDEGQPELQQPAHTIAEGAQWVPRTTRAQADHNPPSSGDAATRQVMNGLYVRHEELHVVDNFLLAAVGDEGVPRLTEKWRLGCREREKTSGSTARPQTTYVLEKQTFLCDGKDELRFLANVNGDG